MENTMNFQFVINFLQNNLLPTILALFTGAIIAFIPARYSATKPMKLEIKKRQFKEVYLPLYKMIHFKNISELDTSEQDALIQSIRTLTSEKSELVFPTLLDTISSDIIIYKKVFKNIDAEYLLLKKSLGYPSLSFFSLLRRFPFKDCIKTMLDGSMIIFFIFCIFIFLLFYNFLSA